MFDCKTLRLPGCRLRWLSRFVLSRAISITVYVAEPRSFAAYESVVRGPLKRATLYGSVWTIPFERWTMLSPQRLWLVLSTNHLPARATSLADLRQGLRRLFYEYNFLRPTRPCNVARPPRCSSAPTRQANMSFLNLGLRPRPGFIALRARTLSPATAAIAAFAYFGS
jgi:hypothetical protein